MKLNFGCGEDIMDGWDNADVQSEAPISFNFDEFPYPIKDSTYDKIICKQVLEHLMRPKKALEELHRISKKNAIIHIEVPFYNNKGSFNDMDHFHYFSGRTFELFVEERTKIKKKEMFEIDYLELTPTKVGRLLPKKLREKLSLFIGGLISQVRVDLKVIKDKEKKE